MLALGCPIDLVTWGAVLTGFTLAKPKVKMEMDMKLNVKAKLGTKVLLAVAWSLVGCSTPRQQDG
jgi:hypothetical protein